MTTLKRHFVKWMLAVISLFGAGSSPLFAQGITDSHDPGNGEPYHPALVQFRMGYYLQNQGRHEEAVAEFTAVIEALPFWDGGYSARGDSYAALEQYELAIADYDAALNITPGFVSVLYMRGRAYQAIEDVTAAQADYEDAIARMPDYDLPYWGLGDLFFAQGDNVTALGYYQQYLSLTSTVPDETVTMRVTTLQTLAVATTL